MVNTLGMVTLSRHVKVALIKPNKRDAFSTALETWAWNYSSSSVNKYTQVLFNLYFNLWFELPRWRLLHFASLCDHFTGLSKSCCMTWWYSIVWTAWNSFMSSANIFVVLLTTSGRSFMKMTNKIGLIGYFLGVFRSGYLPMMTAYHLLPLSAFAQLENLQSTPVAYQLHHMPSISSVTLDEG